MKARRAARHCIRLFTTASPTAATTLQERAEKIRIHQHSGVEFIYVLKGKLELKVGADQEVLDAGDSLYFDAQLPHGYSHLGNKPCSAIVITAE
ncbi:MAG TPA: cupin domain-containing protein [Candidatus Sulfotelmatobacter sp.]|nr:cupin domain-containing protein [Candidatus Sulfotelmatobacter sp.]